MINIFCLIYNNKDFIHDLYSNHKENSTPIYIFDNDSNDGLPDVIRLYNDKFNYINLGPRTGIDKTITQVFTYAKNKYIWLFGDDKIYTNKIDLIEKKIDQFNPDIILLNSDIQKKGNIFKRKINYFKKNIILIKTKEEFINYLSNSVGIYNLFSFISSIIIKKDAWAKIPNEKKLFITNYHHSYKILKLIENGSKLLILNEPLLLANLNDDSFRKNGFTNRILLDFKSFYKIKKKLHFINDLISKKLREEHGFLHISLAIYRSKNKFQLLQINYFLKIYKYSFFYRKLFYYFSYFRK